MTLSSEQRDLPDRIVVGKNGAYWRDYGDHYSMRVVSEDNEPVKVVAIYVRVDEDMVKLLDTQVGRSRLRARFARWFAA